MKRIRISSIFADGTAGQTVTVNGWIRSKRESKGVAFIALNDGSTQETLQLVVPSESSAFTKLAECNTGAAIKAWG
ncbi:MAG TPA: asparagine--tRNA ligase, partial [bacterium]|nr:asparagine--tRNA ligase [bacterium]